MNGTRIIAIIATLVMSSSMILAQEGDKILGTYRVISIESKEPSNVKIYKKGDTYEAQIAWLQNPMDAKGNIRLDALNPNPALRSVRGDQIVLVKGLRYSPKSKKWVGGKIYNPEVGKIYDAVAEFETSTKLKIRGYLGTPTFGKSLIWIKT